MPSVVSTSWAAVACLAAAVLPQGAVSQNVAFNKTVWVSSVFNAYVKPRHEPPCLLSVAIQCIVSSG
jgi:hypothetical protein